MKEIRKWLEGEQDYAEGLALYETHGKSRVVLTALRYGATEFTRQKLIKELRKLLEEKPTPPPVLAAKRVAPPPPAPLPEKEGRAASERDASLRPAAPAPAVDQQRRAWFAERNHLHPQLRLVTTNAERLAMSLRILELGELISQSYAAEATPVAVEQATPGLAALEHEGEMRRLLANLRPQRTKLKKRPDRATDLAQVELDIQLLEGRLKRDGGEPKL